MESVSAAKTVSQMLVFQLRAALCEELIGLAFKVCPTGYVCSVVEALADEKLRNRRK